MGFAITVDEKSITDEDMLHHLNALGDAFANNWCYAKTRSVNMHFLKIEAPIRVPYKVAKRLGYPTDKIEILLQGTLSPGHLRSNTGFQTHLATQIHFPELYDMDYLAEHRLINSYPCAHVRVPAGWVDLGF